MTMPNKETTADNIKPAKKPIKKHKKTSSGAGRPKRDFMTYAQARAFVQDEMIPSKQKYEDWFADNKPKRLPRFPHRVYKEWTTWNDFLGTNNAFAGGKHNVSWRNLDEATVWAHTINLKSRAEWFAWVKLPGNLPPDIPARPDMYYKHWVGWNHFLGNRVTEAALAQQQAKKVQILFILRYLDVPGNVITIGIEPMGISGIRERWERKNFEIVGLFWFDDQHAEKMQHCINTMSTPYLGDNRQRIFSNVWDFVWEMNILFEQVDVKAMAARQE